ncbi:MAG: DUF4349 domain-containing protein [Rubrobacteraceae bacterium]
MPDREYRTGEGLEQELRELGSNLEHPPTPDLASSVRSRIEAENLHPTRRFWHTWPSISPRWTAATAVILVILAVPVFSSTARDTLSGLFTDGGASVGVGGAAQSSGGNESSDQGVAGSSSVAPSGRPESAGGAADTEPLAPSGEGELPQTDRDFERKIIKTADLGLRSKDVRGSAAKAQRIVADFGGNVQSSRIERGGGPVTAELVLQVPAPEFENALEGLRGLGERVATDSVGGEDVTEEFVDLESRERNLLAAEQSLLKLYNEAENVNDSLSIQRELTNVRDRIERVQGRIKYLEQRTDSSRIEITIQPTRDETPPETGWAPLQVAGKSWDASLVILQGLANTAISVAVFSWWIVPLPIAGFAWWRQRRASGADRPDSS